MTSSASACDERQMSYRLEPGSKCPIDLAEAISFVSSGRFFSQVVFLAHNRFLRRSQAKIVQKMRQKKKNVQSTSQNCWRQCQSGHQLGIFLAYPCKCAYAQAWPLSKTKAMAFIFKFLNDYKNWSLAVLLSKSADSPSRRPTFRVCAQCNCAFSYHLILFASLFFLQSCCNPVSARH